MNPTATPYVSTYLGHRFHPAAPSIDDVHIEDIAHGLAFQCRFNGQTRAFYSVAQHSLLVAGLVPARLRLAALLHDAAEAYLGDMVKPLKALFPEFSRLEEGVMAIIGERFGVAGFAAPAIKRADLIALATEKRDLLPHSSEAWASLSGITPVPARIQPLAPHEAKATFLERFRELSCATPRREPVAQCA
ncbi:hydrolase [Azospira restricta]|uniref:Phosphohydrolase n=1 Tax=Azospira restricta TaxID=404405 RepID=A0A974PVM6_9RHOO|nr:hydrolase [Azospira restricta]QRJ62161.1 phosphohydrolase [Azospira restricta]